MLSAGAHAVGLSNVGLAGGKVTLNLQKITVKVSELTQDDLLNHFSPSASLKNPFIQDLQVHFANDYACNAILKISPSVLNIDEDYTNYVILFKLYYFFHFISFIFFFYQGLFQIRYKITILVEMYYNTKYKL